MSHNTGQYLPPPAISEYIRSLETLLGDKALVGIKDGDSKYVYANPALGDFFGAAPEKIIGTTDADWTNEPYGHEIAAKDADVLSSGTILHSIDNFALKEEAVECATIRFPYKNKVGDTVGVTFVAIPMNPNSIDGQSNFQLTLTNAEHTILELQKTVDILKNQVTRDPLTGAWNRRYLEEQAKLGLEMFSQYGHPTSIIFADIDHFKAVNDNWGHTAGDSVLKEFCATVFKTVRATDFLARWGGEEFILLLPNTGTMIASVVAERIRDAVSKHLFPDVGHITASFGIATYRMGEDLDQWVSRADRMMYQAKNNGRNRVEIDASDLTIDHSEKLTPSFAGLNWCTTYECGHPLVDAQHKRLFKEANELLAAILGKQPKEEVTMLINVLLESVTQHFKDEELIFKNAHFPLAEEHCAIHQRLVKQALNLAEKFAEDKLDIGELFSFLANEVVAKHMLSDDRKFFPYLEKTNSE